MWLTWPSGDGDKAMDKKLLELGVDEGEAFKPGLVNRVNQTLIAWR